MKNILFVCTANLCRSPMAEAILRQHILRMGLGDAVAVSSAGVWAAEGQVASRGAIITLAARGADLSGHRSQQVTPALLADAAIVLVMEEAHRRSLFHLAPQHLGKIYLLTELSGGHADVADPYGGSPADYAETADLLERLISAGLPALWKQLGIATPEAP